MARPLADFAEVRIGYKSLLNDFFYVDRETIERFGIETQFLTPLHKLADLDDRHYFQRGLAPTRWLFNCKKMPNDLRGTGAWRYISWGSTQQTRPRKQSEKPVPWPDAPALAGAKNWYWPAATPHRTQIAIRKAIGHRYAPFLFQRPTLLDQRLYTVLPAENVPWEILAAYLSSSLFPLTLEVGANLSLGVGYLTLGTQAFRRLPALDLAALAEWSEKDRVLDAASALFQSQPPDASEYPTNKLIRDLDRALLAFAGVREGKAAALEREIARFAEIRRRLELLKESAAASITDADVRKVAGTIAANIRTWLDARRFPEDYIGNGPSLRLAFNPGALTVETDPILGQTHLVVRDARGQALLDADYPTSVAETILRALQLGRWEFEAPTGSEVAMHVLDGLRTLLLDFEVQFQQELATASLGSKFEGQVRDLVLRTLSVPLAELERSFGHASWIIPGPTD